MSPAHHSPILNSQQARWESVCIQQKGGGGKGMGGGEGGRTHSKTYLVHQFSPHEGSEEVVWITEAVCLDGSRVSHKAVPPVDQIGLASALDHEGHPFVDGKQARHQVEVDVLQPRFPAAGLPPDIEPISLLYNTHRHPDIQTRAMFSRNTHTHTHKYTFRQGDVLNKARASTAQHSTRAGPHAGAKLHPEW